MTLSFSPTFTENTLAVPPQGCEVVKDGHCAYHRRVYHTVEFIAESMPLDRAFTHAAARSPKLFGHELTIDEVLDLYRHGRHLIENDNAL